MPLRTPRSMGELATGFAQPPYHQDISCFTDTHPTESDDDSDYDFYYDFPQPPPISPALRRMRSSPWYSQQLEAIAKPERRHSVSPIIQHPGGSLQPPLRLDPGPLTDQSRIFNRQEINLDSAGQSFVTHGATKKLNENVLKGPERLTTLLPRRMDQLPPPAPAPSIPLPRLPRIIRKVASMRSESKQDLAEPMPPSRRPVPKIKSLKFMSGSMLGSSMQLSHKQEGRKRSWSLNRPTSYQKPKSVPTTDASSVTLNNTSEHLSDLLLCGRAPLAYASPVTSSNPCFTGSNTDRYTNGVTFGPEGRFDLSRGSTSLVPPFSQSPRRNNTNTFHRYSNNSCGEGIHVVSGVRPGKASSGINHKRSISVQHPAPPHPFYNVNNCSKGRNASSGALLQGAKSFINITPERRKSKRGRSKAASGSIGLGNESGGVGLQVGSAMKEKGEKVKKLLARAGSGVVDWGRQLTGRTTKLVAASSTSGSLVPLTGMQS